MHETIHSAFDLGSLGRGRRRNSSCRREVPLPHLPHNVLRGNPHWARSYSPAPADPGAFDMTTPRLQSHPTAGRGGSEKVLTKCTGMAAEHAAQVTCCYQASVEL